MSFRSLIIGFLCLLTVSCKLPQQDPRQLFADGVLPEALERTANQRRELPEPQIVNRTRADSTNPSIFLAGVIDNGFDLAHPLLVDRYAFDISGDRVVGAGLDLFGGDRFAAANLIDPTLFAYGAKEIKNGKIVGPVPQPLELLYDHQVIFYEIFKRKLAENPELKDSIFARKLRLNSVTFLELANQRDYLDIVIEEFTKAEKEKKEKANEGKKWDWAGTVNIDPKRDTKSGWDNAYNFYHDSWLTEVEMKSATENTLTRILTRIKDPLKLAHFYVDVLEEFDKAVGSTLKDRLTQVVQFTSGLDGGGKSKVSDYDLSDAMKPLQKALFFRLTGYQAQSPFYSLVMKLRRHAIYLKLNGETEFPKQAYSLTKEDIIEAFRISFGKAQDAMIARLKKIPAKTVEAQKQQDLIRESDIIFKSVSAALASLDPEAVVTMDPRKFPRSNELDRYILHTKHPYFAEGSGEVSHGTHVSGIIARQNPSIRIYPIRVVTSSVKANGDQISQFTEELKKQLEGWLQEPLVYKAFVDKFRLYIKSQRKNWDPEKDKALVIAEFLKDFDIFINSYVRKSSMNLQFFSEIGKAIEEMGRKKVKVVNMSLGVESKEQVENSAKELDPMAKKQADVDFLVFEMLKYRIAQTIQQKAPGTLFVVAAGNSGGWIDSAAKNALPVDISSPWLKGYESASQVAPNNSLKNILGVGSIDPAGQHLSSFTNLILGSPIPIIYAVGEDVLSSINSADTSYLKGLIDSLYPDSNKIALNYQVADSEANLEMDRSERIDSIGQTLNREVVQTFGDVLGAHREFVLLQQFAGLPQVMGRMSGTSMATPVVVGMMSNMIIEKMKKLGLKQADLYTHPEFQPGKLVEMVMSQTRPLRSGNIVEQLKKIEGEKRYTDRKQVTQLRKSLLSFTPENQPGGSCSGKFQ